MMRLTAILLSAAACVFATQAFADAPVTDLSQPAASTASAQAVDNSAPQQNDATTTAPAAMVNGQPATPQTDLSIAPPTTPLTIGQRLMRLEQQLGNLIRMNLPQQVSDMQQQIQQLNGQLQVQEHELKVLNQQQRSFYQDLDTQIKQIKSLNSGDADTTNNVVPKNTNVNSTPSDNSATPAAPSKDNSSKSSKVNRQVKETQAYDDAFKLLQKKQYSAAKLAFEHYTTRYAHGAFLDNAHYWLGEINLMQKHLDDARKQFNIVIFKFPRSAKVADAKLKLAAIEVARGHYRTAREQLRLIKKAYPGTTAAQLASIQLQQMDLIQQTNS